MGFLARRGWTRPDAIHAGHLLIALLFALWRMVSSTPGASARSGGAFASSTPGRLLAFASVLAGVGALLTVLVLSFRERRDGRVLLLLALLSLALSSRRALDVFDVVYLLAAPVLSAIWFARDRALQRPV